MTQSIYPTCGKAMNFFFFGARGGGGGGDCSTQILDKSQDKSSHTCVNTHV